MTSVEQVKLRLALSILSGRVRHDKLTDGQYDHLGYDPYRFRNYGVPDELSIKESAEEILFAILVNIDEKMV